VIFGVDSHKSSLAICGIDQLGRRVCAATLPNTRRGHHELASWMGEHEPAERLVGVEGAGKYAYALCRLLVAAGEAVVEVPARRECAFFDLTRMPMPFSCPARHARTVASGAASAVWSAEVRGHLLRLAFSLIPGRHGQAASRAASPPQVFDTQIGSAAALAWSRPSRYRRLL
jgi:hypothetical protein